jgi:hypothetical protein
LIAASVSMTQASVFFASIVSIFVNRIA